MRPGGQLEGLLGPFPGAWGLPLGCRGRVSVPPGPWIPEFRFDSVSESPVRANTTEHPPPNPVVWHTCFTQAPPPSFSHGAVRWCPREPWGTRRAGAQCESALGSPRRRSGSAGAGTERRWSRSWRAGSLLGPSVVQGAVDLAFFPTPHALVPCEAEDPTDGALCLWDVVNPCKLHHLRHLWFGSSSHHETGGPWRREPGALRPILVLWLTCW